MEETIGKYIYAIVETQKEKSFGPIGIGNPEAEVYTLRYKDIAMVVSDTEVKDFDISRENVVPHQQVAEKVMREHALLPVRFDTIAKERKEKTPEEQIKEVLKKRYDEFKELLQAMGDKVELSVKVLWSSMPKIFSEIVAENPEIGRLKGKIAGKPRIKVEKMMITLGELAKDALETKQNSEGKRLLKIFKKFSEDERRNKIFGDKMVLNAAFLVKKDQLIQFDEAVNKVQEELDGRAQLRYIGPVPPWNFVEVEIKWDE